MSETLETIKQLVSEGNIRILEHGHDETAKDATVRILIIGITHLMIEKDE
jgi:hypothetical protein